jgi:type III secretory pathway component EscV
MREWLFRVVLLVSLPISVARIDALANAFYSVSLLLLVCHLYFKACDSQPPRGRRKLAYRRG